MDLSEVQASLVYGISSRAVSVATQRNHVLKQTNKQKRYSTVESVYFFPHYMGDSLRHTASLSTLAH